MATQTQPFAPPPTRLISWQNEVLSVDPDWHRKYTRPWIYEFSNGRTFERDPSVYTD
jgi:hypothetical protein